MPGLLNPESSSVVVLENIRSIHNVGAVFRTADGAGFDKIFCCGFTPDPSDPRIAKVALGAEKTIAWEHPADAFSACLKLKKSGFEIVVLETGTDSLNLFDYRMKTRRIALVFGHEVSGVSSAIRDIADVRLEIPMSGKKESLNVSVAAGIAMYEIFRQQRSD